MQVFPPPAQGPGAVSVDVPPCLQYKLGVYLVAGELAKGKGPLQVEQVK